jgi:hypothetical protein
MIASGVNGVKGRRSRVGLSSEPSHHRQRKTYPIWPSSADVMNVDAEELG